MEWIKTADKLPKEKIVVWTKIDDEKGCRNVVKLYRYRNLWFFQDGRMYVYYTPTHWRYLKEGPDVGEEEEKINLYPTECNLCGGKVIFTSNRIVYGKEYGSGKCYYCTECGAYVGTHKPRPSEAFGILANKEMRELKKECHEKFDKFWKGK